jgi:formylglycine-generating enzyme required for sulfatase activity
VRRPATKIVAGAAIVAVTMLVASAARVALRASPCGEGFRRSGPRCLPAEPCPRPLVATAAGCDENEMDAVAVDEATVSMGPSDWEAEGRVPPRTVRARPFRIDRLEVSAGRLGKPGDPAQAASRVTLDEARAFCAARGGRLPTEDEWIVAAAGPHARRYPWGDTGAVCRRAAWGLSQGPCASGADGPDTVGAHPDGATPEGVHDLAGNVAEWVETGACPAAPAPANANAERDRCLGVVRGGSWQTALATELRTWARQEVPAHSREAWIGFRCAYEPLR